MRAGERNLAINTTNDTESAILLLFFLFIAVPRWRMALTRPCRETGKRTRKRMHRVCPAIVWRQAKRSAQATQIWLDLSLAIVSLSGIPQAAIATGIQVVRIYNETPKRWRAYAQKQTIGALWRLCQIIIFVHVQTRRFQHRYRITKAFDKTTFERVSAKVAAAAAQIDPLLLVAAWHICRGPSLRTGLAVCILYARWADWHCKKRHHCRAVGAGLTWLLIIGESPYLAALASGAAASHPTFGKSAAQQAHSHEEAKNIAKANKKDTTVKEIDTVTQRLDTLPHAWGVHIIQALTNVYGEADAINTRSTQIGRPSGTAGENSSAS